MRRLFDALARWLSRLTLAVFFRRVEAVGREFVPEHGPLVVVANHPNGLMDPILLLGRLPRPVRFLGKSTLWDIPFLRPFLALAGVIPVYRRHDPGVDPAKNRETFAACHRALLAGEAIALFPEGVSHAEPHLMPLKTGAARIALAAAREAPAGDLRLLPVGLAFDARERFRTRALLWVGPPLDPTDLLAVADERAAVADLTDRIEASLATVTAGFASWREAKRLQRALEIFRQPAGAAGVAVAPRVRPALAETVRLTRTLAAAHADLLALAPEATARLTRGVDRYDRILTRLHLRDDQIAAPPTRLRALRFALGSALGLAAVLPLALPGTLLNLLPYRIVRWFAHRDERSLDQLATWKLFPALLLYPLAWGLEALALLPLTGWRGVPWVLLTAAFTAFPTLLFHEHRQRLWREGRAYLLLLRRPRLANGLRALRSELAAQVEALAAAWSAQPRL